MIESIRKAGEGEGREKEGVRVIDFYQKEFDSYRIIFLLESKSFPFREGSFLT